MRLYQYRAGRSVTEQEEEYNLRSRDAEQYELPEEAKDQRFLDQRPHRLPWNRKWID